MNDLDVAVCTRAELVMLLRKLPMLKAAYWISRIHEVRKDLSTTLMKDESGYINGWFLGTTDRGNPWK